MMTNPFERQELLPDDEINLNVGWFIKESVSIAVVNTWPFKPWYKKIWYRKFWVILWNNWMAKTKQVKR